MTYGLGISNIALGYKVERLSQVMFNYMGLGRNRTPYIRTNMSGLFWKRI